MNLSFLLKMEKSMSKVTPQSPQPQPKNLFQIIETKNSKSVFLFQNKVHTWKTKTGNSINNFAKSKEFIETRRKVEFFFLNIISWMLKNKKSHGKKRK